MLPCLLFLLAFDAITFANAGLYVVKPLQGSTCHAGKPCTVDWLDDGINPLLTAIGVVKVGLYHGKQHLVQTIPAVNVATAHSLTFTPLPEAGPNSDDYYISMVSTSFLQNTSLPYAAFSSFFRLEGMTGSFNSPDSAATSSISIPSSVATSGRPVITGPVLSTITVGAVSSTSSTPSLSSSSKPAHTSTLLRSSSASPTPTVASSSTAPSATTNFLTSSVEPLPSSVDTPPVNPTTLSLTPSGFSTVVSQPATTLSALEVFTSSSAPLPSDTVANTLNDATTRFSSGSTTSIIVVATLYLVMAF